MADEIEIPLEHTPHPEQRLYEYEGIPFIWGFGDAWGMLQGYVGVLLERYVFGSEIRRFFQAFLVVVSKKICGLIIDVYIIVSKSVSNANLIYLCSCMQTYVCIYIYIYLSYYYYYYHYYHYYCYIIIYSYIMIIGL